MNKEKQKTLREKLATMCYCRSILYISGIITESQNDKIHEKIRKFQERNKIEISTDQLNSIDITYKD